MMSIRKNFVWIEQNMIHSYNVGFSAQFSSYLILRARKRSSLSLESNLWTWFVGNLSFAVFQLSNLQQQRILVEQLRREAAIKRINVSQAIEDLKVSWDLGDLVLS